MKTKVLLANLLLTVVALSFSQQKPEERRAAPPKLDIKKETAAIQKVLGDQTKAWNRADIPGFMDGYVRGKNLRFASAGNVRYGWDVTLKKYQEGYPNRDAMGQLKFTDLKIQILSPKYAEVFGRWKLKRTGDFEDIGGLYTLLMQKTPKGWRVLHDHTSLDAKKEKK